MRTLYYNWLLDELVTRFGEGAVDKVVGSRATERFQVPTKPTSRMNEEFGEDVSAWLASERGGQEIHIPSLSTVKEKRQRAARNHDIRTSIRTVGEIAKKYDLSHRQVINIRVNA